MVKGTGRGKFKERLRRDFHPLPTFRVTDDPFLGSQMTAFAAKFRVTDDRFLGSQMTGEPSSLGFPGHAKFPQKFAPVQLSQSDTPLVNC